jgi:hypothetical protein
MGVDVINNYTVSSVTKEDVALDVKLESVKDADIDMGNMQAKVKDLGGSGKVLVDRKTGLVKERSMTQESTMEMQVQGMNMEMISKTVTTVTQVN